MAMEAVKLIVGAGAPLRGRLLLYEGLSGESRTVRVAADPDCPVCGRAVGRQAESRDDTRSA
jgi:molybdopterin/thiamine biosynthesis adenylyltransferase